VLPSKSNKKTYTYILEFWVQLTANGNHRKIFDVLGILDGLKKRCLDINGNPDHNKECAFVVILTVEEKEQFQSLNHVDSRCGLTDKSFIYPKKLISWFSTTRAYFSMQLITICAVVKSKSAVEKGNVCTKKVLVKLMTYVPITRFCALRSSKVLVKLMTYMLITRFCALRSSKVLPGNPLY